MSDTARRQIVRDAWRLAKPYWTSEEKWSAWGLLLAVIALDLGKVYISVRINAWNNAFYNALQAFNSGELFRQLGSFCILVAFAIAMSVYALYLNQMLQIRWRRWLTRRYLGAWLAGIARCAATQSSEAESVHPAPASAATTRKSSLWRTNAIST